MALADLTRNAVDVLPEGALEAKLKLGRPLRVKLGIDITSPDIHIGRAIPLQRRLRRTRATSGAIIGDRPGSATRPAVPPSGHPSDEEIDANARPPEQRWRFDRDRTEVRYNGEWLSKLSYARS